MRFTWIHCHNGAFYHLSVLLGLADVATKANGNEKRSIRTKSNVLPIMVCGRWKTVP